MNFIELMNKMYGGNNDSGISKNPYYIFKKHYK